MLTRNFYKPRYKIAYQAKSKVWPYKNSRLRRFFNIRGRKLVRRGLFKRIVLVFNKMKWTIARRYIRPFMNKRRPLKRRFKTAFYSKQQLRAFYGKEKEEVFRNFFKSFSGGVKNRGRIFITGIESRADVFLYRLRFLPTIYACRQFIHYFGIRINRGLEHAPSTRVLPGDILTFKEKYWHIFSESLEDRLYWRVFGLNVWKKRERKRLRKKLWTLKRNQAFQKKNLAILAKRRYVFRQFMLTVGLFHPFYKKFVEKLNTINKEIEVNVNTPWDENETTSGLDLQNVYKTERFKEYKNTNINSLQKIGQDFLNTDQVPYFNVEKTIKDLAKNQEISIALDSIWEMPYKGKTTVLKRVHEIQHYEASKSFYVIIWTQFIKKKLMNLWVIFKLKLSQLLNQYKKRKLTRIFRKKFKMLKARRFKIKGLRFRSRSKAHYMRHFLTFINWIFKAYKFLYYYQSQFIELEYRYQTYLSWLFIKPIYEKQELLVSVFINIIRQHEGVHAMYQSKLNLNNIKIDPIQQIQLIDNIVLVEKQIKFWKLTCKEVLIQLLRIKDQFSKELYFQKTRLFSKAEYQQALLSINIIREKLLTNRIKRFMRKSRIVKDRFTNKNKKLKTPILYFRLKRRYKASRRKNIVRFRKVHWYLPSYIYLDTRTLRAVYLYHPKPEEINLAFRCSLKGLQAFYSGAGY